MTKHAISWFEIPVADLDRAMKFYGAVFDAELSPIEGIGMPYAFLPAEGENVVGGALAQGDDFVPSVTDGTLIYLNGGDDLSIMLGRVEGAGGHVLQPKTDIGDNGFIAIFKDTEGNRVGLHSMN